MVINTTETGLSTRIRVKICGITRLVDARNAVNMGADAIGLVFYKGSPRMVSPKVAKEITVALPPFISTVGLFVDASPDDIHRVLEQVSLDYLQFHGNETAEQCRIYSKPYIKAVRIGNGNNIRNITDNFPDASAFLFDTYVKGIAGGTGETFDWSRVPSNISKPIILAGGLTTENIASAIRQVSPYAVDVSGGVESDKGIKDIKKIADFMREVSNAHN